MEGVSSEAASLAGTLKLGKLVYDNEITIEAQPIWLSKKMSAHVLKRMDGTCLKFQTEMSRCTSRFDRRRRARIAITY